MTNSLPRGLKDTLLWSEELGQGFHTRPAMSYDSGYFANYQKLDETPMGAALTKARLGLVSQFIDPSFGCDIGIGGGRYVTESRGFGFDVCRDAVKWLQQQGVYCEPERMLQAATCWDSLEHIPDPEAFVARVCDWLFVSMPIYDNLQDVLQSKHYKPGEHLHYWTLAGFIGWAERQGFQVVQVNHAETELGREGITSFAFRRTGPALS